MYSTYVHGYECKGPLHIELHTPRCIVYWRVCAVCRVCNVLCTCVHTCSSASDDLSSSSSLLWASLSSITSRWCCSWVCVWGGRGAVRISCSMWTYVHTYVYTYIYLYLCVYVYVQALHNTLDTFYDTLYDTGTGEHLLHTDTYITEGYVLTYVRIYVHTYAPTNVHKGWLQQLQCHFSCHCVLWVTMGCAMHVPQGHSHRLALAGSQTLTRVAPISSSYLCSFWCKVSCNWRRWTVSSLESTNAAPLLDINNVCIILTVAFSTCHNYVRTHNIYTVLTYIHNLHMHTYVHVRICMHTAQGAC